MQEGLVLSGKYKLIRQIQVGGQATVYLALIENNELSFSKEVIVKIFTPSETSYDSFFSEIKILTELNHPYIAKIYDVGVHESSPYIVLEYIDGLNLRELKERLLSKNTPFQDGDILQILENILEALIFIHNFKGQRLVHRDISPSNIVISRDGFVKLIDFGISKIPTNKLAGKPAYLPEKVLNGREAYSKSTDNYSLGILIYELLSKRKVQQETDVDLALIADKDIRTFVKELIRPEADSEKVLKQVKKKMIQLGSDLPGLVHKALDEQYVSDSTVQNIQVQSLNSSSKKNYRWLLGSLSFALLISLFCLYSFSSKSDLNLVFEEANSRTIKDITPPFLDLTLPIIHSDQFTKKSCDNYCFNFAAVLSANEKNFYEKSIISPDFNSLLKPTFTEQIQSFRAIYRNLAVHFNEYGHKCSLISNICGQIKPVAIHIAANAPLSTSNEELDRNLMRLFDGKDKKFKRMLDNINEGTIIAPQNSYKYRLLEKLEGSSQRFILVDGDLDLKTCQNIGDDAYLLSTRWQSSKEDPPSYDFEVILLNNVMNILPKGLHANIPYYWIGLADEHERVVDICHYKRSRGKLSIIQNWSLTF